MTSTSRQFQTATDGGSSSSLSLFLAASASFAAASEAFEASVDFAPSAAGAAGFVGSPVLSLHLGRARETPPPSRAHFGLWKETKRWAGGNFSVGGGGVGW